MANKITPYFLFIIILFAVFILPKNAYGLTSKSLTPIKAKSVIAASSYDDTKLMVMSIESGIKQYVYIAFDLNELPQNAVIKSAIFKIKNEVISQGGPVSAFVSTSSNWINSKLTWDNKPEFGNYISSVNVATMREWYSFESSSLIEAIKDSIKNTKQLTIALRTGTLNQSYYEIIVFSNEISLDISYEEPPKTGNVNLTIKDNLGNPVSGATVTSNIQPDGQNSLTGTSKSDGTLTFPNIVPGTYTFMASKSGFKTRSESLTATLGETSIRTIILEPETQPQPQPQPSGGIPGYPIESIFIGILLTIGFLLMYRRLSEKNPKLEL